MHCNRVQEILYKIAGILCCKSYIPFIRSEIQQDHRIKTDGIIHRDNFNGTGTKIKSDLEEAAATYTNH